MDVIATEETTENNEETFRLGLNGKELPADWPKIMSLDENATVVAKAREDSGQTEWNPIKLLSYKLDSPDRTKTLEYDAVVHSRDIDHPEFDELEQRYSALKPDLVLYEAPGNSTWVAPSRDEAIRVGGEVAYVQYLAGKDGVESKSFDISQLDWIGGFKKVGYSNEDIGAYEAARQVYRNSQDATEKGINLVEAENELKNNFEETDLATALKLLPRSDGREWTYDLVSTEYKRLTGDDLTYSGNNPRSENNYHSKLRKMVDDEDIFKEKKMVENITDAFKMHSKVMVVAGSSHPTRQRAALEEYIK